jgi:hypothetical protein
MLKEWICCKCGEKKPHTQFAVSTKGTLNYGDECFDCRGEKTLLKRGYQGPYVSRTVLPDGFTLFVLPPGSGLYGK